MSVIKDIEKAPLQSKKFLAYLLSSVSTKILLLWMISKSASDFVVVSTITAAAFVDIGYILGQAALDKYVRVVSVTKKE